MKIAHYVSIDPNTHHGTPVITGTRVAVSIVIGSLAGGTSKQDVMHEYDLTEEQVEAALLYAAHLVAQTGVVPLAEV